MSITKEIGLIRDTIINTIPLRKLYLFGSYAYGEPSEDSDYDFYAVIPNNSMRPLDAMYEVNMALWDIKNKPMDFLVGTVESFERRSKQISLERTIANKGVLLYES